MSANRSRWVWRNALTLAGAWLAGVALVFTLSLFFFDLLTPRPSPYIGVFTFLVFPLLIILGVAMIAVGVFYKRRQLHRLYGHLSDLEYYPRVDLNEPGQQRVLAGLASGVFVMLVFIGVMSYQGFSYTESDDFCGNVCHTVMHPEHTAHQYSPHARVECTECHVGSGASHYFKSKLAGVRQVVALATSSYSKPIPVAISELRPATETCEHCHWPQLFFGEQLVTKPRFAADESSTERSLRMLMKTGGSRVLTGPTGGIHSHVSDTRTIEFVATDVTLQEIPWFRVSNLETGTKTVFRSDGLPNDAPPPDGVHRTMDCMDCHNRASHRYYSPADSADAALSASPRLLELPYAKRELVAAVATKYETREAGIAGVQAAIEAYYRDEHGDVTATKPAEVATLAAIGREIYRRTIFPGMNVDWRSYPDNIGHLEFPGCFRCHAGKHVDAEGQSVPLRMYELSTISSSRHPTARASCAARSYSSVRARGGSCRARLRQVPHRWAVVGGDLRGLPRRRRRVPGRNARRISSDSRSSPTHGRPGRVQGLSRPLAAHDLERRSTARVSSATRAKTYAAPGTIARQRRRNRRACSPRSTPATRRRVEQVARLRSSPGRSTISKRRGRSSKLSLRTARRDASRMTRCSISSSATAWTASRSRRCSRDKSARLLRSRSRRFVAHPLPLAWALVQERSVPPRVGGNSAPWNTGDSKLADELERQAQRILELEVRLRGLETRLGGVGAQQTAEARPLHPGTEGGVQAAGIEPTPNQWMVGLPALVGRTIVVLGGAFFLRALTENGALPEATGIGAGLAYALAWLGMADRAARAGRAPDATGHGLAATLIAFPLVWETSTRFGLMAPPLSAFTLTVVAGTMLSVAWLRRLGLLAWIVTLASTTTGVALLFATHSLPVFSVALFVLAAISLAASFHREWYGLRWPAAIALDVLVVLAMYLIGKPNYEWLRPHELASVQLLMTATYLGIIGVRTIVLGHPTREFGIVQSLLVLAVGLDGARRVLGPDHAWADAFPLIALGLAVSAYAAAFVRFERDPEQRANWTWYVTLGTLLAIYSGLLLLPGPSAGLSWAALAFLGACLGTSDDRAAVRWNTMVLAVASALGSGLLWVSYLAFFGADHEQRLVFPPSARGTALLCSVAWFVSRWGNAVSAAPSDRTFPGLAFLAVAAIGLGGGVVTILGPLVAGVSGVEPNTGVLAVVRTSVIVASALGFAGMDRLRPRPELVWCAYGALVAAACKIAVDDLPNGSAMTTFMSFVLFGGALIIAPRLVPDAPKPA